MKTFKNIMLCALATFVGSPVAAFLMNFIIDILIWLEALASHITVSVDFFGLGRGDYTDIGWAVITAAITKFFIPFVGAVNIVNFGEGSKYTWPPAVSFFLFSMLFAIYNVFYYMNLVGSN